MDEVECTGRRAAQRGGAASMRLPGIRGLRRFVGIWQLVARQVRRWERRGREDRWGHWGEAAQAVGHRVRVELDFGVVEILLTVTAVRVTVTSINRVTEEEHALRMQTGTDYSVSIQ